MTERPRLLIVDDDVDLGQTLADALIDAGYDAVTACDAKSALQLSQDSPPSLILLDLMMPAMNGWQFRARQLRDRRTRDIPVLVMTASGDLQRHPLRADAFLHKPFTLDELLEQVREVVASG